MIISMQGAALDAVALFAARNDTRHYLNGVTFMSTPHWPAVAFASDGSAMAIYRIDDARIGWGLHVIPVSALIGQRFKRHDTVEIEIADYTLTDKSLAREVKIRAGVTVIECQTLDIPNPLTWDALKRYSHISPSGEPAQFAMQYLTICDKAFRLLRPLQARKGINIEVHHNGSDAAIVDVRAPEMFVVLMPFRSDSVPTLPIWLTGEQ